MNQFTHHQIKAVPENVERGRVENNAIIRDLIPYLETAIGFIKRAVSE